MGNVVFEFMGFKIFGFVGGCFDMWEVDEFVYWGGEIIWLGNEVCYVYGQEGIVGKGIVLGDEFKKNYIDIYNCDFEFFFVVVYMGLIYVNFEGFDGNFDFVVVVCDICVIFGCMVMDDEEMVVLIVGGYIFGKIYGVVLVDNVGVEFEVVFIEQ